MISGETTDIGVSRDFTDCIRADYPSVVVSNDTPDALVARDVALRVRVRDYTGTLILVIRQPQQDYYVPIFKFL